MEAQNQSLFRKGTVKGEPVDDILLDTGSTRTLVHHKLLPPNKRAKGVVDYVLCPWRQSNVPINRSWN